MINHFSLCWVPTYSCWYVKVEQLFEKYDYHLGAGGHVPTFENAGRIIKVSVDYTVPEASWQYTFVMNSDFQEVV